MSKIKFHFSKPIILIVVIVCFNQTSLFSNQSEYDLCQLFNDNSLKIVDVGLENEILNILNHVGINSNSFVLQACEKLENALAITYSGDRYILYGKGFLDSIISKTNFWSSTFILAHEIAHHIYGHTRDLKLLNEGSLSDFDLNQKRIQELEADNFAGFILSKMGASIHDASQVITNYTNNVSNIHSTHPIKEKRLEAIRKGFERSLGIDTYSPNNATDYFNLAKQNFFDQNFSGAIINFDYALNLDPNLNEAYLNRAISKTKIQDFQGALIDYNYFILHNPSDPEAYIDRGLCKLNIKDFSGAENDFNYALNLDKTNPRIFLSRGKLFQAIGETELALNSLNQALLIDPYFNFALYDRANIFLTKNLPFRALKDLNLIIENDPNFIDTYSLRGKLKFDIGDNIGAIKDLEYFIKFNNYPEELNLLGLCKFNLKDYSSAINYFDKALYIDKKFASAYRNRGIVKEKTKDYFGACKDWKEAAKLGCIECLNWIKISCN